MFMEDSLSPQEILGSITTIISLIVAIFSTVVSYRSLRIADKSANATNATVDLFTQQLEDESVAKNMEFHYDIINKIRDLQLLFPPEIGKDDYVPTLEVERLIFVFWFYIFDEWFACNHEGKYLLGFWDKYYEKELHSVMRRPAFTGVLKNMIEVKRIGFFGLSKSFGKTLNTIYREVNGEDLIQPEFLS